MYLISLSRVREQVLCMASYSKVFNLTTKTLSGVTVNTSTVRMGPNIQDDDFYFDLDKNGFPTFKTLTKVEFNFYLKDGSGQTSSVTFRSSINGYHFYNQHNLVAGWNKATVNLASYVDSYYSRPSISISPPDFGSGGRDIEIYTQNSSYKPYATLYYEDTPPLAPNTLVPSSDLHDSSAIIRFSWKHRSQENTSQKGFVLQYSVNDGSSWTAVSQNTSNQYYNMPAGTLPPNKEIRWRVKTIDTNNLESGLTSATFKTNIAPPLAPASLYPNGTIVDARSIIRFSWAHKSQESTQQLGFTLEYSVDNGVNWTAVSQSTSNQYYNMPAETLPPNKGIRWKVKTKDTNELESNYSNAQFNTSSVPPLAPILISPLSRYLDGTKVITFNWSFIGGTAEDKQGKFDLEYSIDKGATWNKATVVSNNTEHSIAENTFQSTNVYWRVKTYNTYGDEGPYSEIGSFFVINSPPIPQIQSVSNSSRPIVMWISTDQQAYEIEIAKNSETIFQTGKVHANVRTHKVDKFLDNGQYLARIRIENEYSLNSTWTEYNFVIDTVKPQTPDIGVFSQEHTVIIKTDNTNLKTLIYRDNELIGEAVNGIFTDYTGENGRYYNYFVRSVDNEESFADSESKIARCKFNGNTIASAIDPKNFLKMKYGLDAIPRKNSIISNQGNLVHYDGRTYPIAEYSEFKAESKTMSFVIKNKEELERLIQLIQSKETLIYRDADGEVMYGAVFSLDYEKHILGYYQVGFTITKTDHKGVAYD